MKLTLAEEFAKLFPGLNRAYGFFNITHKEGDKHKGNVKTVIKKLDQKLWVQLWDDHLNGKNGLGVVPINEENKVYWAAIDIDVYDGFDFEALAKDIKKFKFPLIIFKTKSGGAHVYVFFKESMPAEAVRTKLFDMAVALGFGDSELFPKQNTLASEDDIGNWLNMPYFDCVKKKTKRPLYVDGKDIYDPKAFLRHIKRKRVDGEKFLAKAAPNIKGLEGLPPCLDHLTKNGFPKGTMNDGLFSMGVYAQKAFPDNWEEKVHEYNQTYMKPGTAKEVANIINSLKGKGYFFGCDKQPLKDVCNKALCVKTKYGIGEGDLDLDLMFGTLQKIETNPPTWYLNINGHRIQTTTEGLTNQEVFTKLCIEQLNFYPHKLKNAKWRNTIIGMLNDVECIEAPKDASPQGILIDALQAFCVGTYQAKTKAEIASGKPYIDDITGYTYFKGASFLKYLIQHIPGFRGITINKLYAMLHENGVDNGQMNKVGRVWYIKSFKIEDEGLPEAEEGEMI